MPLTMNCIPMHKSRNPITFASEFIPVWPMNQRADRHPLAEQIRAAIEGCSAADVRERAQHVSG